MLSSTYIKAVEIPNISVRISSPRNIKSNGNTFIDIIIRNNEKIPLQNLELFILNYDDLEIIMMNNIINRLNPNQSIVLSMEIINNKKYYFDKETFITIKISNNEYMFENRLKLTIKAIDKFWLFVILLVTTILIISFILIFNKINKGEENVK
jgi:hypothetical protein